MIRVCFQGLNFDCRGVGGGVVSLSSWGRRDEGPVSGGQVSVAVKFGIWLSLAALALPVSVDDGLFARGQAEVGRQRWAGRDSFPRWNWNKSGYQDWICSKRSREEGTDIVVV